MSSPDSPIPAEHQPPERWITKQKLANHLSAHHAGSSYNSPAGSPTYAQAG
jgi:hypothetical protein